jgi:cell division septal protein FtsQ
MTSRIRERRRSAARVGTREPAIWRAGAAAPVEDSERPQAQVQGRMFASWRLISGLIVVSLGFVLVILFSSDAFFTHSVSVGGLQTMTKEEVFALANIADLHVFWLDPAQIRADLLRSPTIANASVTVSWPPQAVQIIIQEREPALVWEQSGVAAWIDLQGRVMRQRADRGDLLRIQADDDLDGPPGQTIDPAVVNGALQLHQLLPDVRVLRYHPDRGLGFNDPRGWEAWMGTGLDMPQKIVVYNAIVTDLQGEGFRPGSINVADPDSPYYCCREVTAP